MDEETSDLGPGDSMDWTPGVMLRTAGEEADKRDVDAAFAIMLERGPDGKQYNTAYRNAGLTCSETIALLDIIKAEFLRRMTGGQQ